IFYAENSLVADFHVGANNFLPGIRAVPVADRAKRFGGLRKILGLECEIQHAVASHVVLEHDRIFHVGMKNGVLLSQHADDRNWIATLPEKMAEVAIGADLLANRFAQSQQRHGIVDDEPWMHFERQLVDSVFTRKFGGVFPVWNDFFFPLPVEDLRVLRRLAI